MRDPAFKAQLFRFVDVLPSLRSSAEIVSHLLEYLGDQAVALHPALKAGLGAASFVPALVAKPVKAQVVDMARQFVAGADPADLLHRLRANTRAGLATTIDLLGETVVSEAEAAVFLQRNLDGGNLYLNRTITGAIVGRQPFGGHKLSVGGHKLSGGGTKAGGTGYRHNFLVPRVVSENVMRRGFAPPED